MKERPILFSAPMVRAILNGSKSQTRRVVKGAPLDWLEMYGFTPEFVANSDNGMCPYGTPGDRFWVREAWAVHPIMDSRAPRDIDGSFTYLADFKPPNILIGKTRPSIHMPRWASRITLEITSVRVERLQDISEADAMAEGIERQEDGLGWKRGPISGDHPNTATRTAFPRLAYHSLWESINGPDSWAANPWVWVIEFKRIEQKEAP